MLQHLGLIPSAAALSGLWRPDDRGERVALARHVRRVLTRQPLLRRAGVRLVRALTPGSSLIVAATGSAAGRFWDPVENALAAYCRQRALLHSSGVSCQRGSFRHWSLLLAILDADPPAGVER